MYGVNYSGLIFLWVVGTAITVAVLYFVIKYAVKNGINASLVGEEKIEKARREANTGVREDALPQ